MSECSGIRVMIIDDHTVVRAGLEAIISDQHDMQVVAQAGSAEEAIEQFQRHLPDLALVDLCLPGRSGIDLIGDLQKLSRDAKFLVLTAYGREADIHQAFKAGAHAYLLKDASSGELAAAIRTVAAGGRYLPPKLTGSMIDALYDSDLTPREFAVLRLLVRGDSNREIGFGLGITEETTKTYVKHIYSKLGVNSRGKAIAMGMKKGLVHADDFC